MVHLTLSLLALPLIGSAVAQPFANAPSRRHHARLVERVNARAAQPALGKRADGKVCRIRPGSGSSNSTVSGTTSSKVAASTLVSVGASSTSSLAASSTIGANNVAVSSSVVATTSSAAATSTSSSAAAATTSATTSVGSTSGSGLTPNGIKAGIAGGDSYPWMKDHIGWWYDWTPNPTQQGTPIAVSMLWGDGGLGSEQNDASRLATFKSLTTAPAYVLGFEEPDCTTAGSAGIDVAAAAAVWDSVIAPMKAKGSLLGSPSMCKQADETWLTPFKNAISTQWDITAIHVNKNNMAGVKKDIDHYWNTYGKPIWVTEFACVDDTNWTPCTDQTEINTFINDLIPLLESDSRIYAYAYSDGIGLGSVWPTVSNGQLSESGQTYLNAISKYH